MQQIITQRCQLKKSLQLLNAPLVGKIDKHHLMSEYHSLLDLIASCISLNEWEDYKMERIFPQAPLMFTSYEPLVLLFESGNKKCEVQKIDHTSNVSLESKL